MHSIEVTQGDGLTFLEQDTLFGRVNTLILSKKQFADVAWFLANPETHRFRATDALLDPVTVEYSRADEKFTLSQGNLQLVGSRRDPNCGFSIDLWMHQACE